ncbi:DUF4113 domain-containing protein [Spirosoma jeollabukense]
MYGYDSSWNKKQQWLTSCYTTKWSNILTAK